MNNFQRLNQDGRYEDLLHLAENDLSTSEAKLWQISSLWQLGRREEALSLGLKYESIVTDAHWLGRILRILGNIYTDKGNLNKGLEYYKLSYKQFVDTTNSREKAYTLNNLGVVYYQKGDSEQALKYFLQALEYDKEVGNPRDLSSSYVNLGNVYLNQGEYLKAKEYYRQSYLLDTATNNPFDLIDSLTNLIEYFVTVGEVKEVEQYYNQMRKISNNNRSNVIKYAQRYCEALIYKNESRWVKKSKALQIFSELAKLKELSFELQIKSRLNLIELLIYEFQMFDDLEVLLELSDYLQSVISVAETQNMYKLSVESMLLECRMLIVVNKYDDATLLLSKAKNFALKHNLDYIISRIDDEKDFVFSQFKEIEKIVNKSVVATKMQQMEILDYLKMVQTIKL